MIIVALTFFLGILALQRLSTLPNFCVAIIIFCILLILGICWYCFFYREKSPDGVAHAPFKIIGLVCGLSCVFLVGFMYALFIAKLTARWELPRNLEKHYIIVEGYISSLPVHKPDHTAFEFVTETIAGIEHHTTLRLSWFGARPWRLAAADKWRLVVRLKRPHGTVNPGAFDYEQYLWQHKIRATGYVVGKKRDVNLNLSLSKAPTSPSASSLSSSFPSSASTASSPLPARYFLLYLRQKIEDAINFALADYPLTPMINALVVGDQSGISKEQWQIFRDTGTSYLMAIAGLHICWAAGVIFLFVNYLWRLSSRLTLLLPAREAAAIFGLIAGIVYSALSGFSIPTQRALAMLSVFTFALLTRRHTNPWYALCLALCVVLLVDPLAVLSVGFWLSFTAVILIFYVTTGRLQLPTAWWRKYSRMQWAITLGLAPFTLAFFAEASFVTFISNVIALPVVCSLAVPLAILGALLLLSWPYLGKLILLLAEKLLEFVWLWLKWLAIFADLNWHHAVINWWTAALAIVGVLLLLAPRGFCGKYVAFLWIAPLVFYVPPQPKHGEFWFSVLDVGQGLASVIQTQHHLLVYDTGPKFADTDAGESMVVPFVRATGISKIDTMVISHADEDHWGGANSIMNMLHVDKIITSAVSKFPNGAAEVCYSGQEWQWDGVKFRMLWPLAGAPEKGNSTSCVLRVDNGVQAVLLLGDIERAQERYLLKRERGWSNRSGNYDTSGEVGGGSVGGSGRGDLAATVLVVPHHGAVWSSLPEFVEAVHAEYAVFAVGYKNLFNFPAKTVVALYEANGAKTLQTKDTGAITFKLDGAKLKDTKQEAAKLENAQAVVESAAPSASRVFGASHVSDTARASGASRVNTVLLYRKLLRRYWHDE